MNRPIDKGALHQFTQPVTIFFTCVTELVQLIECNTKLQEYPFKSQATKTGGIMQSSFEQSYTRAADDSERSLTQALYTCTVQKYKLTKNPAVTDKLHRIKEDQEEDACSHGDHKNY